jgi:outer membrane protein assembly factor BamB
VNKIAVAALALALASPSSLAEKNETNPRAQWPQWRGPLASGVAPLGDPPVEWSESRNVRWKLAIPGKGHSTPIIWGNHLFVTTAIPHGETGAPVPEHDHGAHDNVPAARMQKFVVIAVDRRDGKILWERTVRDERPHAGTHVTGTWASNSPATDGERVFASFGSQGIYAFDFDGKLLWQTDPGDMQIFHGHGEGSSPVLYKDTLIVNWDHQGESFVVALDARTGKERWRIARDEITSWSTPLIVEHGGTTQVVISATKRVRSYDLASGGLIWECAGLSRNVVASPVAADGFVYVANSYDRQAMLAIRLAGAKGDITNTDAVVWKRERDTPYVPSPLLYDDTLCFIKHNQGFLTCVEAKSGKALFGPQRLEGMRNIFASPVAAADRIYIADRNGSTMVIKRGATFEPLARNRLEDSFSASPAIVGDALYLRGERNLYCIAQDPAK